MEKKKLLSFLLWITYNKGDQILHEMDSVISCSMLTLERLWFSLLVTSQWILTGPDRVVWDAGPFSINSSALSLCDILKQPGLALAMETWNGVVGTLGAGIPGHTA